MPDIEQPTARQIRDWLVRRIAEELEVSPGDIAADAPLEYLGLSSLQAVGLSGELEDWLGRRLPGTLTWDHPTIDALAAALADQERSPPRPDRSPDADAEPIAVIGLGCRFPGADGPDAFWRLLREGADAIREVPRERWDADALYAPEPGTPGRTNSRWGGFLDGIDRFDASAFGISPREATRMDPQQRLALEVAWETLEDAGVPIDGLAGSSAGVFVGISSGDYAHLYLTDPADADLYAGTGSALSIAANRISYALDLRGPSIAVDTACSSSLVALHLACRSLRARECDLALAGGVNVLLAPEVTVAFSQARILAGDGRCKAFDARADGYVRGEGCGMVALKRLDDARRAGDHVLAVVRGSAINQDGRTQGLTAPSASSQQAVIRAALADAGVDPAAVDYVEAHGTGTALGDPIEVSALRATYLDGRSDTEPLVISTVKTNIGHLEAAAGVAGLIKAVLALGHGEIPGNVHLQRLNPLLGADGEPLEFPDRIRPWPGSTARPRIASISSFGFGGTNAHVVVSDAGASVDAAAGNAADPADAPAVDPRPGIPRTDARPPDSASDGTGEWLLPLSARSPAALRALAARYAERVGDPAGPELDALCAATALERAHHPFRFAPVAQSRAELAERLTEFVGRGEPVARRVLSPGRQGGISIK